MPPGCYLPRRRDAITAPLRRHGLAPSRLLSQSIGYVLVFVPTSPTP
jgi:hypothetical protein